MATYSLDITIDTNKFGGVGTPYNMVTPDDIKKNFPNVTKQALEDYKAVYNSISRDRSFLKAGSSTSIVLSNDMISVDLPYEKSIPQTYQFLGMSVNQDFQAVIPVGDGYVVVAELFDRKKIKDIDSSSESALDYVNREVQDQANAFIDGCNADVIRKVVTAIKTGALYDMYQEVAKRIEQNTDRYTNADTLKVVDFIKLIDIINEDLNTTIGLGYDPNIKSVALNLARVKEEDKQETLSQGKSNSNTDASTAAVVLIKCFGYWRKIIENYNNYFSILSAIDLWSNVIKKVIGDDAFNRAAATSFNTIDTQSGAYSGGVCMVAGVARNGSITDANVIRSPISYTLGRIEDIIVGRGTTVSSSNLAEIMVGNINSDNFDDPYGLTPSELQAVSNYDSIQNLDEDAKVCASSYNLNDPEERGLFLKSAIKSYERNFREYKPAENYKVTDAMADLVEKGESFKELLVPEDEYDGVSTVPGYITTDSAELIEIKLTRKNLLKVSKLVDKTLKPISELLA